MLGEKVRLDAAKQAVADKGYRKETWTDYAILRRMQKKHPWWQHQSVGAKTRGMLLGKMSRPKKQQGIEEKELRHNNEIQGVQCQNEIERLALFWGKGEHGVALPHLLSQGESRQSVSINRRGVMKIR
jgi:hypothetical protein